MEECVPECINLEKKSGRLHFCLFRHHDWPEPTLFWIPVDFTERLPVPLKDIVREFIRQFVRHHGLYDVTETFYYDLAIEELEDWETGIPMLPRRKSGRTDDWRIPISLENG